MNTFIKGIIVVAVLLLSGCYVHPGGVRYGVMGVYSYPYSSGYYRNGYNNGSQYRSGYQNTFPRQHHWERRDYHRHDNGYRGNNFGGRRHWQGGHHSGHHGRH